LIKKSETEQNKTFLGPFIPGKAALDADVKKCNKHLSACELSGYGLKAFATDIFGIISPSSNLL
jgi:hypothetical protein